MKSETAQLEEKLGVRFQREETLVTALTHSSYTMERAMARSCCNERLEFLGDAFFDAIIGEELFHRMAEVEEGILTKKRALIVCEESLYEVGKSLQLGDYLRLGKGEESSGGRERKSILADAMEAIIGAVYLDRGYEAAREMVLRLFSERIGGALEGRIVSDYKSAFQEKMQKNGPVDIEYKNVGTKGPDHDKRFLVALYAGGQFISDGIGKSKKEAEQEAAKEALTKNVF